MANYGKRQIRKGYITYISELSDVIENPKDIILLPKLPEEVEDKTYILKLVNGELTWVEEDNI